IAWWDANFENNDYGTGTGASVLTIQGAGTGSTTAYCTNITCSSNDLFYFQDNSNTFDYITFDGMKLNGSSGHNVFFLGQPDYITISNNIITATGNSAAGIEIFNACTNISIKGNGINVASPSGSTYGIYIAQGVVASDVTIEQNNLTCTSGSEATYGIYDDQGATNLTIKNNYIANYLQGFYRDQDRSNLFVYNNSFYCKNYCMQILGSCASGTWKNNILYCYGTTASDYPLYLNSTLSAFTSDYNLFYTAGSNYVRWSNTDYATMVAWRAATPAEDNNSTTGNPSYTNVSTGNLTIGSGSPAANAGITGMVTNDITGGSRNNPPEIGAFEVGSLPIELLYFNASCKQNQLEFNWSTASEINNDFFTVEGSNNLKNWEAIFDVKGAGNSNQIVDYKHTESPIAHQLNYYRLKQTDFDGQHDYSKIISLLNCNAAQSEVAIFPNPNDGIFHISFTGNKGDVLSIEITNTIGQPVFYSKGFVPNFDLSAQAAGTYIVRINSYNATSYNKVEVIK
ncbi:MAG: right-handed parallel beta-helix repeat-containing protein, partial [Bacteroidetes bacterium]|nr:right-handed parallel beta-helix repeat-containing protein [Bacteroidota bacterium]